jgi:hypothetical protein
VVAGAFFVVKELYLQAYTVEEIGKAVGLDDKAVRNELSGLLEDLPKIRKVQFSDDFDPPIYNVWTFGGFGVPILGTRKITIVTRPHRLTLITLCFT